MNRKDYRWMFTAVYGFMSCTLGLFGYTKEVFAVIFGFWEHAGERSVAVSLSVMQAITGASRPAVIAAVGALEDAGLVVANRQPGKSTTYDVRMNPCLLAEYHRQRAQQIEKQERGWLSHDTRTSKVAEPQNITKSGKKKNYKKETNLTVSSAEEFRRELHSTQPGSKVI